MVELTCGFIAKVEKNSERKQISYQETLLDLNARYTNVTFVNLSMSDLGLFGKTDSRKSTLAALISIGVPKVAATNVIRSAINSCIRSTYYLFCKKDEDWLDPDLLVV